MADQGDLQYISALQDYNKSVHLLIKSIQEKFKQDSSSMKDGVLAAEDQIKYMSEMSEKLEKVVENTTETKKDTERILTIVESLKKEKKKGLFDKLSPKDKTKSMAEGIKTIALMAGALLAIGGAFKLIGKVDFASVIALSVALPLLATTFQKIDESDISMEDTLMIGLQMVIMSASLAASGFILQAMPNIGIPQLITAVGVAAAMGVAMYGLALVSDQLNTKEIGQMYLLAGVLPVVAGGILLSAYLLQNIPNVDVMGVLEAAAASAGAGLLIGLAAGILSKVSNPAQIAAGTLSLVIASGGLAASSQLIAMGDYTNYPSLDWAQGYGLSMLASLPVVLGFGIVAATGIGALVILAGIASMLAVAGGLAATSRVIKMGDYTGGPSVEWASGVGLAITSFANALDTLKPGLLDMLTGDSLDDRMTMIVKLGAVLKTTSFLIKGGDYTGGPSKAWSEGVGIAIMSFANSMDALEPGLLEMLSGESLTSRINLMTVLAGKLPEIANVINEGGGVYDVSKAPSKAWSEGVGLSLMAFANAMGALEPGVLSTLTGDSLKSRIAMMPVLAMTLPLIGNMLSASGAKYDESSVPTKAWAEGVGLSLTSFATAIATLDDEVNIEDMNSWIVALMPLAPLMAYYGTMLGKATYDKYPSKEWAEGIGAFYEVFSELDLADNPKELASETAMLATAYLKLAGSLNVLGKSMQGLGDLPDMTALYGGLVTLSLVDESNLADTLDTLNEKQSQFSKVFEMIKASSNVKIDESTFAFNKDVKKPDTKQNNQSSNTQQSRIETVSILPQSRATAPVVTQQDKTLQKIADLLKELNFTMQDVADNTSKRLAGDTTGISN